MEDDLANVLKNREILVKKLALPKPPLWLNQQHTTKLITWQGQEFIEPPVADATWTNKPNLALSVMTADCQPILITNKEESFVVAIHAGWQGLLDGIVTKAILQLPDKAQNLIVWIGPSISQENFEVDVDFMNMFVKKNQKNTSFFQQGSLTKYKADLVGIAVLEMQSLGVANITKSNLCTYLNVDKFYSYRRNQKTGRMATLIWLDY